MNLISKLCNYIKTIKSVTSFRTIQSTKISSINTRHHRYSILKIKNLITTNSMAIIIYLLVSIQIIGILSEPLDSTTELSLNSKSSTIVRTNSRATKETKEYSSVATKAYVPVTQVPKLAKRAGSDSKLKKTNNHSSKETGTQSKKQQHSQQSQAQNRSREALSHEGSERESVVYLSEPTGYVPVTSYRGGKRPTPSNVIPPSAGASIVASGSGGYHTGGQTIELENWRPDVWGTEYHKKPRYNNTKVQHIEAECQDDYMKIRIGFNGSFTGLLYSAGYAYDPDCMYINGSGRDYYEFYIQLNRCGTLGKNALHDDTRKNPTNFMWNTITVQYNPLIEEEFDEHFKVTCEYGYDFWKTVTFPFLDVEVATGNPVVFTLSPPECYMEIRNGYGIGGTRVTGPVRVGDPLTLIIYMRSKYDGFDIVVNDCYAHNGAQKRIQLIDEFGCPVDDKLISRFRGTWSDSGVYETQVYAYMKTFRFTGSPALYIECDVRMCHGRCPSQPCHWRNLKSVTKRSLRSNSSLLAEQSTELNDDSSGKNSQSENINLFQSLRVLQEGEEDGSEPTTSFTNPRNFANETCIRTSVLSALSVAFSLLLCVLLASLVIACSKLRFRKKKIPSNYNSYVTHKGQID